MATACDAAPDEQRAQVPANGTLACTYTAAPTPPAGSNTATVAPTGNAAFSTDALPFTFVRNDIGAQTVTLADPRFEYSEPISETTSVTFPETFTCLPGAEHYTNGVNNRTSINTATLTGNGVDQTSTARVSITCTRPQTWQGETATGAGPTYPGSSNWFMCTPYTTNKVDLIAGQHHDAGDIFMSRSGSTTSIRIVLHPGFRWAAVKESLKIHPFDSQPTAYVSPGQYRFKFDAATQTYTAVLPSTGKAKFFGIHGDVERLIS